MIRDVDLVSYLPPVIADIKEINAVLKAENPEFVLVWKTVDSVLKNEFIATADKYGLERFEKLLDIFPEVTDTLEIRRARVQTKWFIVLPYTWRMLLQKINEICGMDYPITMTQTDCYMISLRVRAELQWQIENLAEVIERMLPCNMGMAVTNVLDLDLETPTPMIKPDWFEYRLEYRGKVIHPESRVLLKVCIYAELSYWGCAVYNGQNCYDGGVRYDAARRYGMRIVVSNRMGLYIAQTVRYQRYALHVKFVVDKEHVKAGCINRYQIKEAEAKNRSKVQICMEVAFPREKIDNISVETSRHVAYYDGTLRYDGTAKYDALYRKEEVE